MSRVIHWEENGRLNTIMSLIDDCSPKYTCTNVFSTNVYQRILYNHPLLHQSYQGVTVVDMVYFMTFPDPLSFEG